MFKEWVERKKESMENNVIEDTGLGNCANCGGTSIYPIPPVIAHATFGRMCMECRVLWESNVGIPIHNERGEEVT